MGISEYLDEVIAYPIAKSFSVAFQTLCRLKKKIFLKMRKRNDPPPKKVDTSESENESVTESTAADQFELPESVVAESSSRSRSAKEVFENKSQDVRKRAEFKVGRLKLAGAEKKIVETEKEREKSRRG